MENRFSHKSNIINALHGENIATMLMQSAAGSSFIYFLRNNLSFLNNSFFRLTTAPLSMFIATIDIIFAWRLFYLERTSFTLTHAIVHTLTSLAFFTAALGLTVGITIFSVVAPILFAAALGLRCLHQTGVALYFYYKAQTTNSHFEGKDAFLRSSFEALVTAIFSGMLAILSTTLLLIAAPIAQTTLASIAIASTLGAIIYCGIKSWRLSSAKSDIEQHKTDLYSTAIILTSSAHHTTTQASATLNVTDDMSFEQFTYELPSLTTAIPSNETFTTSQKRTIKN